MDVRLKRAYDAPAPEDGYRVLVDRLWPRGVSRDRARLDDWQKDLAPSAELRQWFGHDPSRFEEFRRRYVEELRRERPRLTAIRRRARHGTVTLVYSARDSEHNDAVVLAEVLRRGLPGASPAAAGRAWRDADPTATAPRERRRAHGGRGSRRSNPGARG
jgi:uncharacterized protein YeaO (DUF488 family)